MSDDLHDAAIESLRLKGTPLEALRHFSGTVSKNPKLLRALALDYLIRVAAESKPEEREPDDVQPEEVQPDEAAAHSASEPAASAAAGAAAWSEATQAAPPEKKIKVRAHRRHSPEDKAAARAMQLVGAEAVFETRRIDGRPIGDLRSGEVRRLVHENAQNAASYLRLGTEATENAIILDKVAAHCAVSDNSIRLREMIKPATLSQFIEEARVEAPRLVERGMVLYAQAIEKRELDDAA